MPDANGQRLPIVNVVSHDGLQHRAELDGAYINELCQILRDDREADLPPIEVCDVAQQGFLLCDGEHRLEAYRLAGRSSIPATITRGEFRDAVRVSLRANSSHGRQRTNGDLLVCMQIVMADPEWSALSDFKVAEMLGSSRSTIRRLRAELGIDAKAKESSDEPEPTKPKPKPVETVVPDDDVPMPQELAAASIVTVDPMDPLEPDPDGTPWPKASWPALKQRPLFVGLPREVRELAKRIETLADGPAGIYIDREGIAKAMDKVAKLISGSAPKYACPACKGEEQAKPCPLCRGGGWTTDLHRKGFKQKG